MKHYSKWHCPFYSAQNKEKQLFTYSLRQTFTLNWVGSAKDLYDGAIKEVFTEHAGINGGRHEDDSDFRVGLNYIP